MYTDKAIREAPGSEILEPIAYLPVVSLPWEVLLFINTECLLSQSWLALSIRVTL